MSRARVTSGEVAAALARRSRRELSDLANAIGPYRASVLAGPAPGRLMAAPRPFAMPDPERGQALASGRFTLGGETLTVGSDESLWDRPAPSRRFAAALHGFDWLSDLAAADSEAACAHADGWIEEFGRWNWFSWSPAVAARRVRAWLMSAQVILEGPGADGRRKSLARQARRLKKAIALAESGDRLAAAYALTLAGVCLDLGAALRDRGAKVLAAALKSHVLPDGGCADRRPESAARLLCDLLTLDEAARRRGVTLPDEIGRAIDRLAPAVRFFSFGDGGVAGFHGGGEGDRVAIKAALKAGDAPRSAFAVAPHSGYHRLEAGGTAILLDAGGPPPGAHAEHAHASALAFEFAAGKRRVVVNCGWSDDQPASWRDAVRATAAHSALTVEETSSARLLAPGWRRALVGARVARGPEPVIARRNEEEAGVWIEASHEGYREAFGLIARRRLFLSADGRDFRGEDVLDPPSGQGARTGGATLRFAIRFHLHPDVKVSPARDQMGAILALPDGEGWRFRTDGGPIRLERTVYLSAGSSPSRSTQLVVVGEAEAYGAGEQAPNRVRWAFQHLGRAVEESKAE